MNRKQSPPVATPPRLTVRQAATYAGVSIWTIRRYIECGFLPYIQPSGHGGHILINTDDLDRFMREATNPATTGPLARGVGS